MRRPKREDEAYRCPRCGFETGNGHGLAMHPKHEFVEYVLTSKFTAPYLRVINKLMSALKEEACAEAGGEEAERGDLSRSARGKMLPSPAEEYLVRRVPVGHGVPHRHWNYPVSLEDRHHPKLFPVSETYGGNSISRGQDAVRCRGRAAPVQISGNYRPRLEPPI